MKLEINGEHVELPSSLKSVRDILIHYKLEEKPVIIELNGNIIMKDVMNNTAVSDGDRIEIVHFVGGG